jgi:hypothetical protein
MLAEANSEEARAKQSCSAVSWSCAMRHGEGRAVSRPKDPHREGHLRRFPSDTAVFKKVLTDRADELSGLATQARAA